MYGFDDQRKFIAVVISSPSDSAVRNSLLARIKTICQVMRLSVGWEGVPPTRPPACRLYSSIQT